MILGDEVQDAPRAATKAYLKIGEGCEHRVTQQFALKAI